MKALRLTTAMLAALSISIFGCTAKHAGIDSVPNPRDGESTKPGANEYLSIGCTSFSAVVDTGRCEVVFKEAVGATYRIAPGAETQVEGNLTRVVRECVGAGQRAQGTVYVKADVAASGTLSNITVSPGGAVPTSVAKCLARSLGGMEMPPPKSDGSVFMVFMVGSCS